MSTPDRKFMSEFSVGLCSARWLMVSAGELAAGGTMPEHAADIAQACHIYVICRRPASSFDPNIQFDGQKIQGKLIYKVAGLPTAIPFSLPFQLPTGATSLRVSTYPHREIEICAPDGEVVRFIPSHVLTLAGVIFDNRLRSFEVLYVGQAYAEGRRSAFDRLKSHSTLQKILADMQYRYPDDEAVIFTFEYAPYQALISMDGIDKKAARDDRDIERLHSIMNNPLTEHQQICLAEAGLIRYFKPLYNEIYKESFPASDQKILQECYAFDFSALVVEINTEDGGARLFSTNAPASEHHIAKFDLVDAAVRRSFFTFVDRDGSASTMPGIIPRTR